MTMFVKPLHGLFVRDPITRDRIPPEGWEVPENTFWLTRVRHGDVEVAERPPAPEPEAKPESAASEEHAS
jgi:hypothetical protein